MAVQSPLCFVSLRVWIWHRKQMSDTRHTCRMGSLHPGFLEYFAYLHLHLITNVTPIVSVGNPH